MLTYGWNANAFGNLETRESQTAVGVSIPKSGYRSHSCDDHNPNNDSLYFPPRIRTRLRSYDDFKVGEAG